MKITNLVPKVEPQPVNIEAELALANSKFPKSDLPFYRRLGRTDLTVSCLGLGGGGHISSEDTLYAFDRGVNYFFYSSDALTWSQSQFPEPPNAYDYSQTEDIVYFNGQWLWRFTERAEYSYVDKGILFDSTKTSHYYKAVIYCADCLDGSWKHWEGTPRFAEGVQVESLRALPGVPCLLMFSEYSSPPRQDSCRVS